MPNLGEMWIIGFINLIFSVVGLLAVASALGLPLSLGAAAFNIEQVAVVWLLAYSSPIWAPMGAGIGLFTAMRLIKGMRRSISNSSGPTNSK